ncbi:MAG TPA: hypothetical protein VHN79_09090 [Lacunisphaera sp.]|nr:hypothetical protein [Lacunisphaera sp.]
MSLSPGQRTPFYVSPGNPRVFLLSPAHVGGLRAKLLLNPKAPFALAREFHAKGLALASVFTFTSGLYFRGKIAYATHFTRVGRGDLVRVITSNTGLLDPDTRVGPDEIASFGATDIDPEDPAYRRPLRRHALALAKRIGPSGTVVLLGSIATPKYRDVLLEVFGDRLLFPSDFVGRGDMSRGALLLRAARADRELPYQKVAEAILTGRRAAKVREIPP